MSVSEQDVDRVAELANLELTTSEKAQMLRDLNSVLGYFAQLNELDTSSVPPMAQVA
ncbi:MAG: aspartyl-tRNA(Asn)/glutamyl-tRNA(Gln) amidotransferase subunit, partial [Acidobacteriaceae bacterium]|nr:aspartyl-tRNA(Asn)/glutamyl-tRNA(Gln) amidotransferase subunit [Acidobacteriaceae bacterium]